ncbi:hypothetical protein B5F98_00550 [Pseudoflavonifractor sp. An44]|uniref:PcfB family protein n=1 Tax=Pseudoflavonifractor sp. An44 TaxID=1965635 RepID=UPI000B3AB4E7|nr:PcfB family protein [Pseudoflavonifractor sp. An44]OUN99699.1 hypothetical protein B5F98_00550 [Pseudoflavonifractor sp. An44]
MNTSGEAVDQVVRMSLNGVEVAARITGAAAKELAVLLYAILRDQKKTKGKTRLANMLRSGKELKVFAVKDQDLKLFCQEAKAYGALYCVLKNKHAKDGVTDVMIRAEDASKINRIYERFHLATVDMGTIKSEIERAVERPTAERSGDEKAGGAASQKEKSDHRKEEQQGNPTEGRTGLSRPSELTSKPRESTAGGISDVERSPRPSVRQDLRNIRAEQAKAAAAKSRDQSRRQYAGHNAPAKKPKVPKGRGQ